MPEEVKETTSEEEPHRVVHNVYRPVIQEVTEVIQPFRKVLQKIEPVQETMKTIISKAGPPDGQSQQQQHQQQQQGFAYQNSKSSADLFQSQDENRFSRFGGNDLGRGLSIIPIAYGSEVNKKLTSPPQFNENEISRRYGFSNRNKSDETKDIFNNNQSKEDSQTTTSSNKATDYNDIIKDYIAKFIEPKVAASKPVQHQINPNSIKLFNVPMKNAPNMMNKNTRNGEKPKFKIIKEFRVTLDDLKKLKLAPFVLGAKNGPHHHEQQNNNNRMSFNRNMRPWTSFNPMAGAESRRNNVYNSPKRIGDAPPPRHNGSFNRRQFNSDRSYAFGPVAAPNLTPNPALALAAQKEFLHSEAFRRSSEDQAFFESKRLRS